MQAASPDGRPHIFPGSLRRRLPGSTFDRSNVAFRWWAQTRSRNGSKACSLPASFLRRHATVDGPVQRRPVSASLSTRLYFREQCHEVPRHGCDLTAICKHRSMVEEFALDKSSVQEAHCLYRQKATYEIHHAQTAMEHLAGLAAVAASRIWRAASSERASGFSHRTCLPFLNAAMHGSG